MLQSFPAGWAQLSPEELNAELGSVVLLDVRTAAEVAEGGSIEGAVNIPLEELVARQAEWPASDAAIAVYDANGYRGDLAQAILRGHGYANVRNLRGGFAAWQEAGFADEAA